VARAIVLVAGKDPFEIPGGHSTYVRVHARAALRAGYEPHLFCVGPSALTRETDLGVLHRVASPYRPFRQTMLPFHGPRLARAVADFVSKAPGPWLVHAMGLLWGWVAVEAAARLERQGGRAAALVHAYTTYVHETQGKVRGVGRGHGPVKAVRYAGEGLWVRGVIDRYERRAYRDADAVFVNYETVRRLILLRHGRGPEIGRMPYTTERALTEEAGGTPGDPPAALASLTPRDAPLVVAVSRHDPRKGIDVLLRALALLRGEGVPFRACVVGWGGLLDTHRALAASLGLADAVLLTGEVPDPHPWLRGADVFVLPSLEEGSGSLSLLEAMHAGVTPVASRLDGIPEDVTDGENALLVEPGRPRALAAALRTLLEDPARRARLAAAAHRRFEERFAAEHLVEALGAAYRMAGVAP
jgi:glycosyltransferase involved in cell wall biosynthesis